MFNAIVISWFLSVGWVPLQTEMVDHSTFRINPDMTATMTEIGLSVTFDDRLKVFTEMDNYQYKDKDSLYFLPYRIDYTFGSTLDINKYISVTATHTCIHDVIYNRHQPKGYQENETKVYATIHGETRIK